MKGFCPSCDALVVIRPGPLKTDRQRWWIVEPHVGADDKPCKGGKI